MLITIRKWKITYLWKSHVTKWLPEQAKNNFLRMSLALQILHKLKTRWEIQLIKGSVIYQVKSPAKPPARSRKFQSRTWAQSKRELLYQGTITQVSILPLCWLIRLLTRYVADFESSPVRMIVSTTRSPRIFPIKTGMSTFDQILEKKIP